MSVDRDDRDYLAAGYALGGLSDDDRSIAAGLLETDPSFRREVAEYEDSLAGLAETDEPLTPSADVAAAILAIPRSEGGSTAAASTAAPVTRVGTPGSQEAPARTAGTVAPAGSQETPREEPVSLSELRASRRTWRMLAGAAAAAVIVAVAGLGGALLHVTGEQRELDESLAQSQEQLDRAEQLLTAPDVRTETVDMGDDAGMTVVSSLTEQMFQVRTHGAPSVPDDRVMQLWLIDDTGAHSVGFLADGAVTVDGSEFAGGALVGVTEEPAGGSEQPTSDPLAVVEL
ncbi:anti-sigma factor [Brevibacterium jeotgali]|uniref:Regulator of SigK n=1 Tax=Brevibacterium jeotgali TaxID=1262550 RepID=A0A2H1L3L3_9MICO|nr:anti-sigma factor [Brevibacterium jeotgali]TWC01743.1 anti-sigma-K factor RskA [Brevibacterium jeotgali]SMY11488.1 Anti-sigma-K factor RskA [Brevibacterium jeotgali]